MNPIQPNKLMLSKWTAVEVVAKQKHFLVSKVYLPEQQEGQLVMNTQVEFVELEAVYTKAKRKIAWRELTDTTMWKQGWV
ncbi:TIGR02450 family Trp-rich protein [Undibacterium umbellatum]|uniref:TIGR02450 family Trp-rich protein n=1 Tax=Undibacterium umbellatum TaxID=2762300 RepID=A0ABR6Z7M9_9BURK|nr:TIGR02450 family Trp-rich protein [Undibacterium umbellatum]MBC3907760.1 TIGR02450 family Trp-rich protein [Undibacterium umbellatum]